MNYKDLKIEYIPVKNAKDLNNIKEYDTLIWLGSYVPDFSLLKRKNVYIIYYNTEPNINIHDTNEIWTYSKCLFKTYKKNTKNQKIKFLPIVMEKTGIQLNYLSNQEIKLVFMGSLNNRREKKDKLLSSSILKNDLIEVYNLWNDNDYNHFIENKSYIFLNLTKTGTNALPSVRINKLLSHKCIIISEHTNEVDEVLYKDLLYFCNIEDIENVYSNLKMKSKDELQAIADTFYNTFRKRFCIQNIDTLIEIK